MTPMTLPETAERARAIVDEVEKAIVGKRETLEMVLLGILGRGHVLLEDFPGLAKTLIARSFARVLGVGFSRIQFTPDLLPSDITGASIYDQRKGDFEFRKGPVFANLVLGDEINRAPPKTQAALLEAMQEGQVTVEDTTHVLPPPFTVIATENPIEYEGTYALPEAQLDRFVLRIGVGYPTRDEEWEILSRRLDRRTDEVALSEMTNAAVVLGMQDALEDVHVSAAAGFYAVDLVHATRVHPDVQVGSSPRGALALVSLARGRALLEGRDFVIPEDVKAVAPPALGHRLTLRPDLWVRRVSGDDVVRAVLDEVPAPAASDFQADC